ncbi:lysophospholipid acyltransferase family protein [Ferruginibacter sp. SUN002]|uniref:lysophospholipid acyltransferase family protein n=1 Tax=Ferruginibacter sp. SUN002 TaxID=2937789 RepID=UPI003D363818
MIKNIFARIWALWGLLTFVATFLIIFLPSMIAYAIPNPGGQIYFIMVSRIWMNVWLFLVGCPVKITGRENFQPNTSYIVVFNHNALLDVPLSAPYVPGANKTIAKASFAKVPLFGFFYSKGAILVNRKDELSRKRSFEAMKQVLLTGMHMCIYPEGTRNRTQEPLKQFYDGAFKLAIDAGKDILPCVISGTKKAMPIDKFFYLLPTKLRMDFLPPVSSNNTTVKDLKEKVFDIMKTHFIAKNN